MEQDSGGSGANSTRRKLLLGAGGVAATAATSPLWINVARAQAGPIKIGFPVR